MNLLRRIEVTGVYSMKNLLGGSFVWGFGARLRSLGQSWGAVGLRFWLALWILLYGVLTPNLAVAATTVDMASVPLLALKSAPGLVMLTVSRDQRLFYAAYNEVTDLDGDGSLDVGFEPTFTYYGYFDSSRCYKYDTGVTPNRFVPVSLANAATGCNGAAGRWHGNWLNWMTTSRMDALRKVLYGGKRLTDTNALTVLEAAHIPPDSHIWGKEFRPAAGFGAAPNYGTDAYAIANYTPLAAPTAGKQHMFLMKSEGTGTSPYIGSAPPTFRVVQNVDALIDRIWLWASSERPVGGAAGTTNYTRQNPGGNDKVVNPTASTLINYGVPGFPNSTSGGASYGNSTVAYSHNFVVRVETCVALGGVREANCTGYPVGSTAPTIFKPTGVLHDYGYNDQLKFGLLTGSYLNNYSGGVLRKDVASFTDEYVASTGIFTNTAGIVKTLNGMTTIGFNIGSQTYQSNSTIAACPAGTFMWDRLRCQGEVNMWGSPVAEMMYESLRYFTDKQPLAPFASGVSAAASPDSQLGLPLVSTWANPYRPKASGGNPICSRPVQMVIADPITSFDSDQLPGAAFSPDTGKGSAIPATDLTGLNVSTEADAIWANEFGAAVTKNYFMGQTTLGNFDGNPTVKPATTFKYMRGHAPDETNTQGSYYAASVAKFARGTYGSDKKQLTGVKVGPTGSVPVLTPVDTIAVALGSVVPKFQISYGGQTVSLVPFSKSVSGGCSPAPSAAPTAPSGFQPSNLITGMFIDRIANTTTANADAAINSGRPFARFMVSFSDMDVGGDNEADFNVYYTVSINALGRLNIVMSPYNTATCVYMHAGYVISGTTADGAYLEVRDTAGNGKYYMDTLPGLAPAPSTGRDPGATPLSATTASRTFTLASTSASGTYVPHDPLWYAAKYGGAGVLDSNGDPTNYFKVTNPSTLPAQMGKAFRAAASLAAVASTSVVGVGQRSAGTAAIYQANYDSLTWSSRLYAFPISTSSVLSNTPMWEVSSKIPSAPASRAKLLLGRGGSTTPVQMNASGFTFSSLTAAEQTDFGNAATFAYLLGDKTGEERNGGSFRNRGITSGTDTSTAALALATYGSVLGDVVNSDPQIIAKKDYGYTTATETTYASFWSGITSEIVAVGSNNGFFHLFDATPTASGGGELLAFMPQAARTNIKDLASPSYSHRPFIDGSIGLGHAKISTPGDPTVSWRSVVVAAGGGGAQTVFAIDTTTIPMTAGSVMWEVNQNTSGVGSTLGNVMGRPAIGKLPNSGTWVAIFGNGYNSTAGTANLYVVRLSDGVILRVIPTNTSYTGNGLGSAEIVRKTSGDADTIEYVYGADYKGNIWRFDLSGLNAGMSNWPSSGALIYTTPTGRPITAEIKVGAAPTGTYTTGGKMIYFGTGSYLSAADPAVTTVQALYGIYDDLLHGLNNSPYVTDASLSAMTISMAAGADTRTTSNAASPAWYTFATKKGWVVALTGTNVAAGERVIAPPVRYTISGLVDAFLFTSIVPSVSDCDAGLDAWITGVDAMTGGYAKVFHGLDPNSVKIAGGSPRGVFVLQDGAQPSLYISQTVFNGTVSSTTFTTGTGGTQEVTINGVTGETRIISIDLTRPVTPPAIPTTVKQVWRQLK